MRRIDLASARVTETPNAVMTTLASPTQGGTISLSLWRVSMRAGQHGPLHSFDGEQAWHLLDGTATVVVDDEAVELETGDTLVLPAASARQVSTKTGAEFVTTGLARAAATPITAAGPGEPVFPSWTA